MPFFSNSCPQETILNEGVPGDDTFFERSKSEVVIHLAGCVNNVSATSKVSFTAAMVGETPEEYLRWPNDSLLILLSCLSLTCS